jgi:hypothetical protein
MDELARFKLHVKYNVVYLGFILGAIIVILITVDFGQKKDLAEKLQFSLAMGSLLLACVAIVHNSFSSYMASRNTGSLNQASRVMETSAAGVVEASQTIGKASTDLANDSKALSGIAEDLVEKFRDLGEFREAMVAEFGETREAIGMLQEGEAVPSQSESTHGSSLGGDLGALAEQASPVVRWTMYAVALAKESGKGLGGGGNQRDRAEGVAEVMAAAYPEMGDYADYVWGVLVMLSACGVAESRRMVR